MNIYGFTLLRNGIKYDYPFRESLTSLAGLCDLIYIALGQSEDGTESALSGIPNLVLIPTVWDENLRKSGLILSEQTNIALRELRKHHSSGWAICLQADELIFESQYDLIRSDMEKALAQGCDAISFRYLHFWQSFYRFASTWRWYPQEIRAVRVDSDLESYGDAQSFGLAKKIYYSDAFVLHYGHVREPKAYQSKLNDFHRWWHNDDEIAKVKAKGRRREKKEETIAYLGPHPICMKERIKNLEGKTEAPKRKILVFGLRDSLPEYFWKRINADLMFSQSIIELWKSNPRETVVLEFSPLFHLLTGFRFFQRSLEMKSPNQRPWPKDFLTMLKFSQIGITTR